MRISKICVWLVLALYCLNYEVQAKGRSSGGSRSSSRSRSRSSSHSSHSHSNSGGGFWRGFKNLFSGTKSSHSSTRSRSSYDEFDWDYNSGSSHRSMMSTHSNSWGYNSNPSYANSYLISSSSSNIPDFTKILGLSKHNSLNVPNDDVSNYNLNTPVSIPNPIGLMDDVNNPFNINALFDNPSMSFNDIQRNILNIIEKSSNTHHVSSTTKPSSGLSDHNSLNVPNDDVSNYNLNNPVSIPNPIGLMDDVNNSFDFNAILDNPNMSLKDIQRNILNIIKKSSTTHHISSTTKPSSDNLMTENTTQISDIVVETVEPKEETTAQTTQQTIISQSTIESTTTPNSVTSDANTIETTTTTTSSWPIEDDIAANVPPSILYALKSSTFDSTTALTSVSADQNPSETAINWLTEITTAATTLTKSTTEYLSTTDSTTTLASVTSDRIQSETSLENHNESEDNVRLVNMKCKKVILSKYNKLGYFIDSVENICEPASLTQNDKKTEVADPKEKSEDDVRSVQMKCRKIIRSELTGSAYFLNSVDEICEPETLTQDDKNSQVGQGHVEMMCKHVLQSEYNDRPLLVKSTKLVCKSEVTKIRWAKES